MPENPSPPTPTPPSPVPPEPLPPNPSPAPLLRNCNARRFSDANIRRPQRHGSDGKAAAVYLPSGNKKLSAGSTLDAQAASL